LGLRVQVSGFRFQVSDCKVQGFKVYYGVKGRVYSLRFRVSDVGFRVQDLGFRI
jgi:hypothetical protein